MMMVTLFADDVTAEGHIKQWWVCVPPEVDQLMTWCSVNSLQIKKKYLRTRRN